MQIQINTSATFYEMMRKQPVFFVKFCTHFEGKGDSYHEDYWWEFVYNNFKETVKENLTIRFWNDKFGQQELGYCLCIIDKAEQIKNPNYAQGIDMVNMYFHDASISNERDCQMILNDCIVRSNGKDDKYAFVKLLWLLDKQWIDAYTLSNAIKKYDSRTILILNVFRRICRCLSLNKQNAIKYLFCLLGEKYEIYMPSLLVEAVQLSLSFFDKNANMFQLIDKVIGRESSNCPSEKELASSNILLQLRCWLHSEEALNDYNILKPIFSMVAEPIRLEIVKRYFHDIRLGNTTFSTELVMQFKDNHFYEFIRYRYATETPAEPIVLTVPLLCDTILTLYNSKGVDFLSFNGVLDLAMTYCDKVYPAINFKLDRFIPKCQHGAVYNSYSFAGFIDFKLVCKIKLSSLTDSFLLALIRQILDKYGTRQQYPVCKFGDGSKIEDSQFERCSKDFVSKKSHRTIKLECYTYKNCDDKWLVSKDSNTSIGFLSSFLKDEISEDKDKYYTSVDLTMVSTDVFRKYILSLFEKTDDERYLINSSTYRDTYKFWIVEQCSDIIGIRIFPQEAIVGTRFDVFGYFKKVKETLSQEQLKDKNELKAVEERYLAKEKEEVKKRTIDSLKKEIGIHEYNGFYFEVPYNKSVLDKMINKYYFKSSFNGYIKDDKHIENEFLTSPYFTKDYYCAPELSVASNPAIDLPFFWCMGKECFHNSLEKQTLSEMDDWHTYSLYHLIEIIGYPKLHTTTAGYEPDPIVRKFIAIVNRAVQKFNRLKCRTCGHLMFTDESSGFNRYNYYSCVNSNCSEAWKPVYLNYCYKCKKGFIDSRDTKQCPNGWYICPTCLACCDDAQYKRLAQRYILSNRPVPDRIQKKMGHGHNNKGYFFCPDCGTRLKLYEKDYFICPFCKKSFYL